MLTTFLQHAPEKSKIGVSYQKQYFYFTGATASRFLPLFDMYVATVSTKCTGAYIIGPWGYLSRKLPIIEVS